MFFVLITLLTFIQIYVIVVSRKNFLNIISNNGGKKNEICM